MRTYSTYIHTYLPVIFLVVQTDGQVGVKVLQHYDLHCAEDGHQAAQVRLTLRRGAGVNKEL